MSSTSLSTSRTLSPGSKPRAPRLLRVESEPDQIRIASTDDTASVPPPPPPSQIYVLSADGSSLFLLDPTKPQTNEEPPPYAPFRIDTTLATSASTSSLASTSQYHTPTAGPSTPAVLSPVPLPSVVNGETRHRASTVSTLQQESSRAAARPRVRNHSSFSHNPRTRESDHHGLHSTRSSPGAAVSALPDERTPLLQRGLDGEEWVEVVWPRRRGTARAIFCGEMEEGDEEMTWAAGWRRFWRPVGRAAYWKAMCHLWFLNFPFALFVWPPLLVGTLAGTALLITLPIGAAVWWLTLFIARSAARLETIMQLKYHSPIHPSIPPSTYHPIFHRIKERSTPSTPLSEMPPDTEILWEKRFIKCSYAMFCDHYSYSALSYFLLIKPLIVLFSSIFLWALFPPALVLVVTLPVYLRAARRWGSYQAGIAIENL